MLLIFGLQVYRLFFYKSVNFTTSILKDLEVMIKFQSLLILFLTLSLAALSQQKINGLVEDNETGIPISYASVIPEKGGSMITDSIGKFSFVVKKDSRLKDSILISAVGYSPKKIAIKDLLSDNKIKLIQKEKVLEQVKVFASLKGDYRKFGYYRSWQVQNEGGEIGYVFEMPATKIQIGRIQVKVNHNYDTCWLKLHLRDIGMSDASLPENEVSKKEMILPSTVKYGLVEFDLNWEPITIPTYKLYVGFELLRCGCSKSTAPSFFFVGNEQGLNFFRESEKSVWKRGGDYTIYVRMMTK